MSDSLLEEFRARNPSTKQALNLELLGTGIEKMTVLTDCRERELGGVFQPLWSDPPTGGTCEDKSYIMLNWFGIRIVPGNFRGLTVRITLVVELT